MRASNRLTILLLVGMLFLTACNLPTTAPTPTSDPNAVFTAAARTVEARLTEAAPLTTPTLPLPPSPTATRTPLPPTPTPLCDLAQFVQDVTVPDGTVLLPGEKFTKTWRLRNMGTCTWNSSYSLVFDSGDALGGVSTQSLKGNVSPGQEIDISIELTAPPTNGTYRGYWRLRAPNGAYIPVLSGYQGNSFFVDIKVEYNFAVTGAVLEVVRDPAASCAAGSKYVITAKITTNGPGTVAYHWVRSDGTVSAQSNLVFAAAGTQSVTYEWPTVDSGLNITLYIDSPAIKQYGPLNLNCP